MRVLETDRRELQITAGVICGWILPMTST